MRLTIIPSDGMVSIDNDPKIELDLTNCDIPNDVHALQWYTDKGWIEFSDDNDPFTFKPENLYIEELPQWALNCCDVWAQQTEE
jgi:hypothetical protein